MKLTKHGGAAETPLVHGWWVAPAIGAGCLIVFGLDYAFDSAPLQHLYYLPIILAAREYGVRGGIGVGLAAAALYVFANHFLLSHPYLESDILQTVLFVAVGAVSARLAQDARRMRELAMTDDLTGLHNLRSFEARLREFVLDSRVSRTPLSMLVLDVDRLKDWNDRHGHLAGAEAVRAVGRIIAKTAPAGAVACRYGGDEFAIALPNCSEERAEQIAALLCRNVNAFAPSLAGQHWPAGTLTVSVGVASRGPGPAAEDASAEEQGEVLFRAADEALYVAKGKGRNRVFSGPAIRGRKPIDAIAE
jgi:diguanylate cyclase (GGDEF)-like protein